MSKKKIVQYTAAGGVVFDGKLILLLDRPSKQEIRLPKGHIEDGESAEIAALRETAEEAGYDDLEIVADLGSQLVEFDYKKTQYIRTEHYFVMRLASHRQVGRPENDQEDFVPMWVPQEEAASRLTFESERAVVQNAIMAQKSCE